MIDLIEAVCSLFGWWSKIQHGTPFSNAVLTPLAGDQHPSGLSCFLCFPGPHEFRGGRQEASWLGSCAAWRVLNSFSCVYSFHLQQPRKLSIASTLAIKRIWSDAEMGAWSSWRHFLTSCSCQTVKVIRDDPRELKVTGAVNLWATLFSLFPSSDWTRYSFKSRMKWLLNTLC